MVPAKGEGHLAVHAVLWLPGCLSGTATVSSVTAGFEKHGKLISFTARLCWGYNLHMR